MRSTDRFAVADVACRLGGRWHPVVDLSVGGFFVQAGEDAPPPGQLVDLELRLGAHAPARVRAKVVWRDETGASRRGRGFGVQITRIDLRDKIALVDWLRRTQQASSMAGDHLPPGDS